MNFPFVSEHLPNTAPATQRERGPRRDPPQSTYAERARPWPMNVRLHSLPGIFSPPLSEFSPLMPVTLRPCMRRSVPCPSSRRNTGPASLCMPSGPLCMGAICRRKTIGHSNTSIQNRYKTKEQREGNKQDHSHSMIALDIPNHMNISSNKRSSPKHGS